MDALLDFWNSLPDFEKRRVLLGIATTVAAAMFVALLRFFGNWLQRRAKQWSSRGVAKLATNMPQRFEGDRTPSTETPPQGTSPGDVLNSSPAAKIGMPQALGEYGIFTFLFTDVEGSTRLWEQSPEPMRAAMARLDALIESIASQNSGHVIRERGEGDSHFIIFHLATDAVSAAAAIQEAIYKEPWPTPRPLRVRIAIHTGEADRRESEFYGSDVNRCARIRLLASGGQTLISQTTRNLVADTLPERLGLRDVGVLRLRDLQRPERLYQLLISGLPSDFPPIKSPDSVPNNLPLQLTSFIGREREIQKLTQLLGETRLLSLTGPGGCGKTRLALQVAADVMENYEDGVWFVELAPLPDAIQVPHEIATALGVREAPSSPLKKTLADFLCRRSLLLILDNCEHLVEACAQLVAELLNTCTNLRVMVTSREVLGISGESIFRVPSLALPDPAHLDSGDALMRYESVRLFVDRAMAMRADFQVTNPVAVAQICQRLDGIPLAIELAAARVKVMTVEQILARLDDRFRMLTGGNRTALPRQQTLRALIDWSYDLLPESERVFFHRLSVFLGGASLDAIEEVCACQGNESYGILEALTGLVDKSLVLVEMQETEARYRLSETIRQYAQDKLLHTGDADRVRRCHRDYFLRMIEEGDLQLRGANQSVWLVRLENEYDNILAALEWSYAMDDVEACLRFGGALWLYWNVHGNWTEGRERLAKILTMPGAEPPTLRRARALNGAGFLTLLQGDHLPAREHLEASLSIGSELGARVEIAYALFGLGSIAQFQGDYSKARSLYDEGLELFHESGDQWGMANALLNQGVVNLYENNLPEARRLCEKSLTLFREIGDKRSIAKLLGNLGLIAYFQGALEEAQKLAEEALAIRRELHDKWGIANQLDNLGYIAFHRGELDKASALFRESLVLLSEIGTKRTIADVLCGLGGVAAAQNHPERAAQLFGAGEALFQALGARVEDANRTEYERGIATARAQMNEGEFEAARSAGKKLSMEQAIALAGEDWNLS